MFFECIFVICEVKKFVNEFFNVLNIQKFGNSIDFGVIQLLVELNFFVDENCFYLEYEI